jgi:hypothetical protein
VIPYRLFATIVLAAATLATSGHGWSQMPGGSTSGGRGSSGVPGAGRGPDTSLVPQSKPIPDTDAPRATVRAAVQYRLELLEEDLRLRPDQDAVWAAYRDRVLKLADDIQRAARTALGGEMPAPQRLDRLADIARDRLTALEDIGDAGRNLYAVLSPAQKSVADKRMGVPVMALVGVEPVGGSGKNP